MPNVNYMSTITLPVNVSGTITDVEFTIKDAETAAAVANLAATIASWGSAIKWIGATTTPITDGDSTNPITINGALVTAVGGNMTAYNGQEFVWDADGSVWQEFGSGNLGTLAYQNSASTRYTPAGTVSVTQATAPSTTTVNSITAVGALPYFTVSGSKATFVRGTLPTKGANTTVLTSAGTYAGSFTGTQATITVS